MTNKISIADVINVAESIGANLSIGSITDVMNFYDGAQASDPTSNFTEIIESIIYSLPNFGREDARCYI